MGRAQFVGQISNMHTVTDSKKNSTAISACVIGDIMLDVVTILENSDLTTYVASKHVPKAIMVLAGGSGTMLALAARAEGFGEVFLIGKIGADSEDRDSPDISGRLAVGELQKAQVEVVTALARTHHTGIAMITYLQNDQRLLVADKAANGTFTKADISTRMRELVIGANVLFVSGYSLLETDQAMAVHYLMKEASRHGRLVVLDVVPHVLYRHVDSKTFLRLAEPVSVLVSEVNTAKRLFFTGDETLPTSEVTVERVAERLLEYCSTVILRPTNTYQYVRDRCGIVDAGPTGYERVSRDLQRGYTDELTVRMVARHYPRFVSAQMDFKATKHGIQ